MDISATRGVQDVLSAGGDEQVVEVFIASCDTQPIVGDADQRADLRRGFRMLSCFVDGRLDGLHQRLSLSGLADRFAERTNLARDVVEAVNVRAIERDAEMV